MESTCEMADEWAVLGDHAQPRVTRGTGGVPFFFTPEMQAVPLVGRYRGGAAFFVCSGPSFASVPKEKLRRAWCMTTNNATASYRGEAAIFVDEPSRFSLSVWKDPKIMKFIPTSLMASQLWDNRRLPESGWPSGQQWRPAQIAPRDCPNVFGFRRNARFEARRFLSEDTVNWGNDAKCGGGRSVMMAGLRVLHLLGFRKVFLVGCDFKMDEVRMYHFAQDRTEQAIKNNMATYAAMKERFAQLQPHFLRAGFIVKNCNPESGLAAFPFIDFEDAIQEACSDIGTPELERTQGMYQPLDVKRFDAGRSDTEGAGYR